MSDLISDASRLKAEIESHLLQINKLILDAGQLGINVYLEDSFLKDYPYTRQFHVNMSITVR